MELASGRLSVAHFARASSIVALCEVVGVGAEYLTAVLITRSIGAAQFGIYTAARTLVTLLAVAGTMGLRQGVVRHLGILAGNRGGQKKLVLLSLVLAVVGGSALGTVLWIVGGLVTRDVFRMSQLIPLLPVLAVTVPLIASGNVLAASLTGLNRVSTSALIDRAIRPVSALLLTIPVLLFGVGVTGLVYRDMAVAGVAGVLSASIMVSLLWDAGVASESGSRMISGLVLFSLPLLAAEFIHVVMLRTDVLMLAALRTDTEVGVFGAIARVAWVVVIPLTAIDASTFPALAHRFGRRDDAGVQAVYSMSVRWALLVVTPVVVMLWLFAHEILALFGPEFVEGAWALRIVALGFWVRSALGSVSGVITMGGYSKGVLYITLGGTLFNIAANYFLVPPWGIHGAALATGGIMALTALAMLRVSAKRFAVEYEWSRLLKTAGVGVGAGALALGARLLLEQWQPMVAALSAVVVALMAVLLGTRVAGLWHSDDRALLVGLWKRISRATG